MCDLVCASAPSMRGKIELICVLIGINYKFRVNYYCRLAVTANITISESSGSHLLLVNRTNITANEAKTTFVYLHMIFHDSNPNRVAKIFFIFTRFFTSCQFLLLHHICEMHTVCSSNKYLLVNHCGSHPLHIFTSLI